MPDPMQIWGKSVQLPRVKPPEAFESIEASICVNRRLPYPIKMSIFRLEIDSQPDSRIFPACSGFPAIPKSVNAGRDVDMLNRWPDDPMEAEPTARAKPRGS